MITGAGAASGGTLDASNSLKPACAVHRRAEGIGATTYNEYLADLREGPRRWSRRFQKVDVSSAVDRRDDRDTQGLEDAPSSTMASSTCRRR
ncbi:MAG: hypothetical protein U1F15_16430 [Burkholderiales bacterium]